MGLPAATAQHQVIAVDTHLQMVPTAAGPVPTPLPAPFSGMLDAGLIQTVKIGGQPAAVQGSSASNQPSHLPTPPATSYQIPPKNQATVEMGSATVAIGGKAAARGTDPVRTCNDPSDLPVGQIIAAGTVLIG